MSPMIDDIRNQVADLMRRRGVVRAGIFGSFARGEGTESSDVDFLVEFEHGRSLLDLSGLRLDLTAVLGREVDVATPGSLHPCLRDRILAEVVPLL
jgi:predicted nucleotidyltransferase